MDPQFEQVTREAFGFLEREHGARAARGGEELRYDLGALSIHVYPRPPLARRGGVRFQVPLDEGAPYRFDLAEVVWYRTNRSPDRDRFPAFVPRAGYEERLLPAQAGRLRMYCPDVLAGDVAVFREMVELRRAGRATDPRRELWSWFTSRPPVSPLDEEVNLPSPDGTVAVRFSGQEVHMSGPVQGFVLLSNGRAVPACSPVMVWSADSKHLAILRMDAGQRRTTLAVVGVADGSVADVRQDVGFPALASFDGGVIESADGLRFDAREAIRRLGGPA